MISTKGGGNALKLAALRQLNSSGYLEDMFAQQGTSVFADTYNERLGRFIDDAEKLDSVFDHIQLETSFDDSSFQEGFSTIAKLIKARTILGAERDVFMTGARGFDSHANMNNEGVFGMLGIDEGLKAFTKELKAQGIWENVTVLVLSEFGRTISTNGRGTDHGWSGNTFALGGSLKGGKIYGQYPHHLSGTRSKVAIGTRGVLLPTLSWDAMWNGLSEWMGVPKSSMPQVLPNLENFSPEQLFSKADLFKHEEVEVTSSTRGPITATKATTKPGSASSKTSGTPDPATTTTAPTVSSTVTVNNTPASRVTSQLLTCLFISLLWMS